jgi:hypothetical protein
MITKFEPFKEKTIKKYWEIPIDEFYLAKINKIGGVSKDTQEFIDDQLNDLIKRAWKPFLMYIGLETLDIGHYDVEYSFNWSDYLEFEEKGYVKQPDIELTPEEIEEWKFNKDTQRYNL